MKLLGKVSLKTRFADQDSFNHINNARYLNYIEQARVEVLAQDDLLQQLLSEGLIFVVTSVQSHFLRPLQYNQLIEVYTFLEQMTPVRGYFIQHICLAGQEASVFVARVEWIVMNSNKRPINLFSRFGMVEKKTVKYSKESNVEAGFTCAVDSSDVLNSIKKENRPWSNLPDVTDGQWQLKQDRQQINKDLKRIIAKPDNRGMQLSMTTRYSEMDSFAHINHAAYFSYFEEARWSLFRSLGIGQGDMKQTSLILGWQSVNYYQELSGQQEIYLSSWRLDTRKSMVSILHAIYNQKQKLVAVAIAGVVHIDNVKQKPTVFSELIASKIAQIPRINTGLT